MTILDNCSSQQCPEWGSYHIVWTVDRSRCGRAKGEESRSWRNAGHWDLGRELEIVIPGSLPSPDSPLNSSAQDSQGSGRREKSTLKLTKCYFNMLFSKNDGTYFLHLIFILDLDSQYQANFSLPAGQRQARLAAGQTGLGLGAGQPGCPQAALSDLWAPSSDVRPVAGDWSQGRGACTVRTAASTSH